MWAILRGLEVTWSRLGWEKRHQYCSPPVFIRIVVISLRPILLTRLSGFLWRICLTGLESNALLQIHTVVQDKLIQGGARDDKLTLPSVVERIHEESKSSPLSHISPPWGWRIDPGVWLQWRQWWHWFLYDAQICCSVFESFGTKQKTWKMWTTCPC